MDPKATPKPISIEERDERNLSGRRSETFDDSEILGFTTVSKKSNITNILEIPVRNMPNKKSEKSFSRNSDVL